MFGDQKIITVLLDEVSDLTLNIGEKVIFGEKEDVVIKGWKLWPERLMLDIIVDDEIEGIVVGERVQIIDNRLS